MRGGGGAYRRKNTVVKGYSQIREKKAPHVMAMARENK